jgi:adenine deaminase
MCKVLSPEEMRSLMHVALGEEKADLLIGNADLVNVYSGELLEGWSVAVKGNWIAYVGPDPDHAIGPQTEIIDASGKVLIPGLIDAHTHMIWYCTPYEFLRYAAKGGTTTFVTEIMELAHFGYQGILTFLQALEHQPVKIFATAPPAITLSESFRKRTPSLDGLKELLRREDVLGVGEGYWQDVLRGQRNFPTLASDASRLGKSVEGHAAGCRENKLQAYLAYGVSSCHESVSAKEVLEKLRAGMFVMVREGSIRKELDAIAGIKDEHPDFRHLALVTDGVDPRELVTMGHLECVVQRAIELGFDPIAAIQMATLNPAQYFHLDRFIGGLAPGKCADMVIIPDLRTIRAECVISNGRVIAREGRLHVKPRWSDFSLTGPKEIRVDPNDFTIHAGGKGPFKIRVIDYVTTLVTREKRMEMVPIEGQLQTDPEQDLLKASVITCEGKRFTGFVRGFGLKTGALAASNGWEISGIIAVGVKEGEIARAVNRVAELGGGIVLYVEGQPYVELPLSIGGIMSSLSAEAIAEALDDIQNRARDLGSPFEDVCLALATLTTPAIPFLRICEDGLVDLKKGEVVGLIVS